MGERAISERRRRRQRRSFALLLAPLLAVAPSGCLVEKGRCGPNQENNAVGNCVCEWGFVAGPDLVCAPCGANQVALGDACVCTFGYARDATQHCVPVTGEVGAPCTTDADCPSGGPHCHRPEQGDPYCTITGCTQLQACPGGYGCELRLSPTVCVRPPTGLFDDCKRQEDCAGKEASYCENTVYNVCAVPDCRSDADCFGTLECCDLTAYGVPRLCVAGGVCPVE